MKKIMVLLLLFVQHMGLYAQQAPTQAIITGARLKHKSKSDWQPEWANGAWKLPEAGRGAILFRAGVPGGEQPKAFNDITLFLSDQPGKGNNYPMYEVIIGGWNNTQTTVRTKKGGTSLPVMNGFPIVANKQVTHSQGRIAAPANFRAWHWLLVDKNSNTIAMGEGPIIGQNVVHVVKHDDAMLGRVQYIGFTAYNRPIQYDDIQILPLETADNAIVYNTNDNVTFHEEWKLPQAGNGLIRFQALAHEEICVLLSPKNAYDDNHYQVILGGEGNTKNVLIKNGQEVFAEEKRGIAHPGQLCDYYIKVDATVQKITVGQGRYPKPENIIFEVGDAQFNAAVQYFGFKTGQHVAVNYFNIKAHDLHERGRQERDAKAEGNPAVATPQEAKEGKEAKKVKKKKKKKAKKAKKKNKKKAKKKGKKKTAKKKKKAKNKKKAKKKNNKKRKNKAKKKGKKAAKAK